MTSTVRRAGAFAAVGTLAIAAPVLDQAAAVPFVAIALLAAFAITDGPLFELFARPGDREDRRLYGLVGFTLAATGLGILAVVSTSMPLWAFVGAVFLLGYGNLGAELVRNRSTASAAPAVGFGVAGTVACFVGSVATVAIEGGPALAAVAPALAFFAASGALLGALLRTVLFERDDPMVMLSVGLTLWLLSGLVPIGSVEPLEVAVALSVTLAFGYVSYALETASVAGMLTGILLSLLTIVLGGLDWFLVLISFFGIGALSTKFRYEEKLERGVAQENEGARGSANVLANGAVALVAVVGYAASNAGVVPVAGTVFLYVFCGSLATAMSDTLSSEIGGVFDNPRLITTLKPVEPGTDGGVTWQGEVAGVCGAAVIGGIALIATRLEPTGTALAPSGAALIVAAGVVGMTADSLLGATIEGQLLGNQGVNLVATVVGAVVGAALAVGSGIVALP